MELPQVWNSALATLAVAAVIIAAWMYLREYRKTEKGRAVMFTVAQLVRAAEQQFAAQGLDGPARRAWVLARAKEYFPDLNAEFLIDLIEAAVYDLNQEQTTLLTAEIEDIEPDLDPAQSGYFIGQMDGDSNIAEFDKFHQVKAAEFEHLTVDDLVVGEIRFKNAGGGRARELKVDEAGHLMVDGVRLEERCSPSYRNTGEKSANDSTQPLKSPALGRLTIEDLHTGNLTTELQIGRLDGVIDPDLGPLSGYGLYVKGGAILHSVVVCLDRDVTLRTWNLADAEESEEL